MDVCAKLRGILHEKRVGHAGTLDPMATGVLPVFVGQATKAVSFAEGGQKVYEAVLQLGLVTDTQDTSGNVLETHPVTAAREEVQAALRQFLGPIEQIPPMYSAIKINGQKLYELARKGREIERPARRVTIHALELLGGGDGEFLLRVRCSKGTYVRTLCHDIGQALACPAHMRFLLREQTGAFDLSTAVTIEQIKAAGAEGTLGQYLIASDAPLSHLARYDVPERYAKLCMNGVRLRADEWPCHVPCGGYTRLYVQGRFMGISQAAADGTLVPCVVFNNNQEGCTQA